MTFYTNAEPGVTAVVKRFGNSIETYDIFIKSRAYFKVHNINSNMVQQNFLIGLTDTIKWNKADEYGRANFFHDSLFTPER